MLDIRTSREDALKVHPLPLNVDPDICKGLRRAQYSEPDGPFTEKYVNPVELVLP